MNRLFDKKPKKLSKSSRRHISLGIPTNIAVGPLGFRADLDIGPKGECTRSYHDSETDRSDSAVTPDEETPRTSRIVFHDKSGENQELPAPEASTSGVVVDNAEHGNALTSASDSYHHGHRSRRSLCLSPPEENAGDTREREGESAVVLGGVCGYRCVVHLLLTMLPVPEIDCGDTVFGAPATLIDTAKETAGGFGPLKTTLEVISDYQVRLRFPVQNSSLTNESAGNRRRQKQDRGPPRAYSRAGGTLCATSRRCGRTEAPE